MLRRFLRRFCAAFCAAFLGRQGEMLFGHLKVMIIGHSYAVPKPLRDNVGGENVRKLRLPACP